MPRSTFGLTDRGIIPLPLLATIVLLFILGINFEVLADRYWSIFVFEIVFSFDDDDEALIIFLQTFLFLVSPYAEDNCVSPANLL